MDYLNTGLTALFSAVSIFILSKLMGNKQISQLSTFDYITGITIGSIAAEMATSLDKNPLHPLIAMVVYALLDILISLATDKSVHVRKLLMGRPYLLLDNGIIYRENFKKAKIDLSDFLLMCREAGYFDITQIQTVILEHNGAVSILPKAANRPATPNDLGLSPEQEYSVISVIMDGNILKENLKITGNDENWLKEQLKAQDYKSEKEIYFATWYNNNLTVYPMDVKNKNPDWFD